MLEPIEGRARILTAAEGGAMVHDLLQVAIAGV